MTGKIGLTLNEGKTHICDARRESFDFLGYTFGMERRWGDGVRYMAAKPSKKSVERLHEKIGAILRPGNMDRLGVVVTELNRTLSGWNNYFSYGATSKAHRAINNYVLFGVRRFLFTFGLRWRKLARRPHARVKTLYKRLYFRETGNTPTWLEKPCRSMIVSLM